MPDLTKSPLVRGPAPATPDGPTYDTAITSTRGFVITEAVPLKQFAPLFNQDPAVLVNALVETRPRGQLAGRANTVLLNRSTGQELIGGAP
jgi:hypothetical protein